MPTSMTLGWLFFSLVLHKMWSINELEDVDIHVGLVNDCLKENMLRILEYIFV
jgi:hypothetical protein